MKKIEIKYYYIIYIYMDFKQKYFKYKNKYLQLQGNINMHQSGGNANIGDTVVSIDDTNDEWGTIVEELKVYRLSTGKIISKNDKDKTWVIRKKNKPWNIFNRTHAMSDSSPVNYSTSQNNLTAEDYARNHRINEARFKAEQIERDNRIGEEIEKGELDYYLRK